MFVNRLLPRRSLTALVLLILLVAWTPASAQDTGVLAGQVADQADGAPLPGTNVVLPALERGTTSDAQGRFAISGLPPGSYRLRVSFVGFATETRTVEVTAGDTTRVEIVLRARAATLEGIRVSALRPDLQPREQLEQVEVRRANPRDAGELLREIPGMGAVRRGPVGLDPVVRGLRETEVGVYLDYTRLFPGGPARMDSPLSHLDPSFVQSIDVVKGPYALTWGAGNLSAVRVTTKDVEDLPRRSLGSSIMSGYDSNLSAFENAVSLQGRRENLSIYVHGAHRRGSDYEAGNGRTVPADFLSREVRTKLGYRVASDQQLVLSAGYQQQDDIDYPGRLLNARYFDVQNYSARWSLDRPSGTFREASVMGYHHRIDHGMDNRGKPTAEPDSTRMPPFALDVSVRADMDVTGGRFSTTWVPDTATELQLGGDFYHAQKHAIRRIARKSDGFVPPPLRPQPDLMWADAALTDAGLFGRLDRSFGEIWNASGTLRLDLVRARADTLGRFFREHVSTDRTDETEGHLSGAFTVNASLSRHWQVTAGLGSAIRTPDLKERFSDRIPASKAQTSAEFVGTPTLDPERSTQADLWLEGRYERLSLTLNGFARRIDDYVGLRPTDLPKRLPLSPPTVFRYASSTAVFYGGEMTLRGRLSEDVSATVQPVYLWGRETELEEPALGISPFSVDGTVRLEPAGGDYYLQSTVHAVSEQERIARLRGETPTDGYVTLDVKAGWTLWERFSVNGGVTNLLDTQYVNHLNAKNPYSGVPIPEPGRVLFVDLRVRL